VAVVLFHAAIPGFSGGFVGVDVFFVISGYLITQLLLGTTDNPLRLRLPDFYIRRARRILPALYAMTLVALVLAVILLLPWDLARFGRYLAATSVMGTNIAAWKDGVGYFQSKLTHVPLLHLWSIAIEEQFYLTYPLTLVLICRYLPRHRTQTLIALAVASFAVCVWGSYHAPAANFFLAPSRAWELLLGGALATGGTGRMSRLANELLAFCGLVVLALAVYWYRPTTPYPGIYSIPPCAASAILILTGRQQSTLTGKFLSMRPLVFTGLISYSLYLWHFPALLFFSYYNIVTIGAIPLTILLAWIYIVGAASWMWIEKPVRTRVFLKSNRSFLWCALLMNIILLGAGITLSKSDGLPQRFPPEVQTRGGAWLFDSERLLKCTDRSLDEISAGNLCSFGPQNDAAQRVLVWGDSHATALLPAYEKFAVAHRLRLYYAVYSSCRPLIGFTNKEQSEQNRNGCARFNDAVAGAVRRLDPRLLILNAHWIDNDADLVSESTAQAIPGESNFTRGLRETLRETGSIHRSVCVVLDVPEYKYDLPNALGIARKRGIAEDFLKLTRAEASAQYRGPERDIKIFEQRGLLRSVDPKDLLCRDGTCVFESAGNLLYWDSDHLSFAGAQFVSSAIDGCLQDIAPAASKRSAPSQEGTQSTVQPPIVGDRDGEKGFDEARRLAAHGG
jgi:peptidoglycan/LPS O-acetylase OafA/YrhL